MVPTVDLGLRLADFWSMETAGDSPSMKSTSGLSIWPRNCLAYADKDSTYRRCPSAKIVSNARLDLPEPESPVKTIIASRGRSRLTSRRLCSRAPRMINRSCTQPPPYVGRVRRPPQTLARPSDKKRPRPCGRSGSGPGDLNPVDRWALSRLVRETQSRDARIERERDVAC